jgi:hypothetical protein
MKDPFALEQLHDYQDRADKTRRRYKILQDKYHLSSLRLVFKYGASKKLPVLRGGA